MEDKKEKIREPIYDFIRVISCICIIAIHCTDRIKAGEAYNSIWWVGNIIQSIVRIGLPMFVLLSGALILNSKEESVGRFYWKRFIKIVIPLFMYSFIYIYGFEYNCSLEILKPINLWNCFIRIMSGSVYSHLWFVYMIIGIYLCAPFLKKMCQSLTDKECNNLFIVLMCISIIKYLLPSFNIKIGITSIAFVDWILIFILGYLLTRKTINKHYKIIYCLGILSFVFSIIAHRWLPNMKNLYDHSIFMLFQVMAIFIFYIRNKDKICKSNELNALISFFSKYTWEIYLIHAAMMRIVEKFIKVQNIGKISYSIIETILVTLLSFAVAFIIYNLVTKNIEKILNKIYDKILKHKKIKLLKTIS